MLTERLQSSMMRVLNARYLDIEPVAAGMHALPEAVGDASKQYMLYAHIPFCERLCPYCSFNRFPFNESRAQAYYKALRDEMHMVSNLGYDFASMYIGGGTPTVLPDELAKTIDLARELFSIKEVSCETNPNHLIPDYLDKIVDRVQRLSIGIQSFSDVLLKQMDRYDKYGSGLDMLARLQDLRGVFQGLNADMIFNFPSQTEDMLLYDLAAILESGCSQTTFYPLMASPVVERSLAQSVGRVDYRREQDFYEIISLALTGEGSERASVGDSRMASVDDSRMASVGSSERATVGGCERMSIGGSAAFRHGSAWTFNALSCPDKDKLDTDKSQMIDEYIVDYEEYPAIGSGGFSYLDGTLYVNTFSVPDYIKRISEGRMSVMGQKRFSGYDRMRYRFMMQLFGLRLDKQQWLRDFGCSVAAGVPAEYAFYKTIGAFEQDNHKELVLSAKGRYLLVALMRQFFIGVNGVRDEARSQLPPEERELLFGC